MEKPKLVWAPFRDYMGARYPEFDSFLGPNHGVFYTIIIRENKRRGMELDHHLTLYYRDYDEINSKSIHRTVEACHGLTVPYSFPGDYVVMCGRHSDPVEFFGDITLADFRHVQDYFSTYYDKTIRETPSGGSVLAVQINCALEQRLYARDTFASVAVDRDFMVTASALSPISKALGNSIRVCKLDSNELKREGERMDLSVEDDFRNPYADILLTDMDPISENWGKCIERSQFDGNVILLSQDRADLTVELVQTMAGYCLEILKPLFEKSMRGEISRQEVLSEISPEKMMWKSAEATQDNEELTPRRGFVAQIGSMI